MAAPSCVLMRESAVETGKKIVEQTEAVRRLDLDQRVVGMSLVIHGDASRKFDFLVDAMPALTPCFFHQRRKVEVHVLQRIPQSFFDELEIPLVGNGAVFRVANSKDIENDIVSP